jgi:AcrR family transcriptional regulator
MSKYVKSEETRERILAAAIELFRQRSFDRTTMREIAADAGVALGGAYYYFESKEALVMAYYERSQREMEPLLEAAIAQSKDLRQRLRAILQVKFDYFHADRALLGALSSHTDPQHPLSPFSSQTAPIRDHDISFFERAIAGANIRTPADLLPHMPRLLWMYQMGLILFWVYDDSPLQQRTANVVDRSLRIVVNLIRFSTLPLMRPVRKQAVELLVSFYGPVS